MTKPLLRWFASLSVGIVSIDEQYKKLVKMVNDLYKQMRTGAGKGGVGLDLK